MITQELLLKVFGDFALDIEGPHGETHWRQVCINGRSLARLHSVDSAISDFFALFHDCRRRTEASDPKHGYRAAQYARSLRGAYFELPDIQFDLLYKACQFHSYPIRTSNKIIQTCWDADRLDLGRFGAVLDPNYIGQDTLACQNLCYDAYRRLNGPDDAEVSCIWTTL